MLCWPDNAFDPKHSITVAKRPLCKNKNSHTHFQGPLEPNSPEGCSKPSLSEIHRRPREREDQIDIKTHIQAWCRQNLLHLLPPSPWY